MADQINVPSILDSIENFDPKAMSLSDIPRILIAVMEVVEKVKGMSGIQKKTLVIEIVTEIVDDSDLAGYYENFILSMIPNLIDQLVEADKGHLKLNSKLNSGIMSMLSKLVCKCTKCTGCKKK